MRSKAEERDEYEAEPDAGGGSGGKRWWCGDAAEVGGAAHKKARSCSLDLWISASTSTGGAGARSAGGRASFLEPLPAPAPEERMQGVRGRGHLPAPAREEQMQGVRGGEHLSAPAPEEQVQGVRGLGWSR